jgi:hypothetical protein
VEIAHFQTPVEGIGCSVGAGIMAFYKNKTEDSKVEVRCFHSKKL